MRAPRVIAAGRWRRRLTATLALVIAIAVVIAVILGTESPSSLKAATGKPLAATAFLRYVESKYLESTASSVAA